MGGGANQYVCRKLAMQKNNHQSQPPGVESCAIVTPKRALSPIPQPGHRRHINGPSVSALPPSCPNSFAPTSRARALVSVPRFSECSSVRASGRSGGVYRVEQDDALARADDVLAPRPAGNAVPARVLQLHRELRDVTAVERGGRAVVDAAADADRGGALRHESRAHWFCTLALIPSSDLWLRRTKKWRGKVPTHSIRGRSCCCTGPRPSPEARGQPGRCRC